MIVSVTALEFSLFKVSPMKVGEMGRAQLPGSGEMSLFANDTVYLKMHVRMIKFPPHMIMHLTCCYCPQHSCH